MSTNIKIKRVCEFCKNEFIAKTTRTRYCSHKCNSRGYKKIAKEGKIAASNKETELIKNPQLESVKELEFLSINQTCLLFGISRRTLYRIIERGELDIAKFGKRTILRRCDLDAFFSVPPAQEVQNLTQRFPGIEQCYTITQIQKNFGISPAALYMLLQRQGIAKYAVGKFTYVAKRDIDIIFNTNGDGK